MRSHLHSITLLADRIVMMLDTASRKSLKKFGLRIRELRDKKGWSLEDTEEYGYPSWQHLQTIESGKKNITFTTAKNLSRLFKISLSELFEGI